MKYLGRTVLLLAICGWAFWGGMEFQRHRQNTKATAPATVASAPAPARVKGISMTSERAVAIAVAHIQQSDDGADYFWFADTWKTVFHEDTRRWRVSLEAFPKPDDERKSKIGQNGKRRTLASARLTELEITSDGKIDEKKSGMMRDW